MSVGRFLRIHPMMTHTMNVMITGAGSGIGRCFAGGLANRAKTLVLLDIDAASLQATTALLSGSDCRGIEQVVDVSNADAVDTMVAGLPQQLESLDLLINCAAILGGGPWTGQSRADFERVLHVDLLGTINMIRATLPWLQRGRGHIVNLASTAALHGWPGLAAYSAAKFGVVGYSEAVRAELASLGIGLTLVFPLLIDTPLLNRPGTPPILRRGRRIAPEVVVTRVLDAVQRRRSRVYIPRTVRLVAALEALAPSLLDWYGARFGTEKSRIES